MTETINPLKGKINPRAKGIGSEPALASPDLSAVPMPSDYELEVIQADRYAMEKGRSKLPFTNAEAEISPTSPGPETSPVSPAASEESAEKRQGAGRSRDIGNRGSRTDKPLAPPKGPETTPENERGRILAELKAKMEETADLYAKFSGEANASQAFISRLVGKHKEYDPMIAEYRERWIQAKDLYEKALNDDLRDRFEEGKINEKEYRLQTIDLKHESLKRKLANDERKIYFQNKKGEDRGWLSKKVEKGMGNFVDRWRKMSFWKKFGGAVALGLLGGPASVVGLGALRIIGAVAGGKAAQEKLQAMALEKRKENIEKEMRKFEMAVHKLDPSELYQLVNESLDSQNGKLSDKIVSEANWDAGRKITGILTGVVIEELGRLGVGKMILNKGLNYFGYGAIGAEAVGGKGAAVPPESAGKGVVPEKVEKAKFWGAAHKIESGTKLDNSWAVTRHMYMEHARSYGYDPNDPRIHKWFNSYRKSGILGRMGIRIHNFDDLSEANKIKIWAEHETATSVRDFKVLHGGKAIPDLVHDGDSVILNGDHTIELQADSGIKPGYLHHDIPQGKGGLAAADNYPRGRVTESIADQRIRAADEWQARAQARFAETAATSNRTHEALVQSRGPLMADRIAETAAIDNTQTHKWMDFIQSKIYGSGTGVDWHERAADFRKRMLGSFLTSDQPMGPPANVGEQQQYWQAAQELNRKLGPTFGNESTESWLQRGLEQKKISPEDVIGVLSRVVNQ